MRGEEGTGSDGQKDRGGAIGRRRGGEPGRKIEEQQRIDEKRGGGGERSVVWCLL